MKTIYVVTTAARTPFRVRARAVVLAAVALTLAALCWLGGLAVLLLGAADALLAAWVGVPRLGWLIRSINGLIAESRRADR
ncbi:hypothetical protein [Nonomuraea dietziae]|uniref:hypothetical protein n=1 Tax=Nonomuraea dietziae TaxID=65515 RepID=UPI0034083824